MKILLICYELPPIGGGGGRAALQVGRRLVTMGHSVTLLTSLFEYLPKQEIVHGIDVRRMPVRRKRADECTPFELLSFMWRSRSFALQLADEIHPDITLAFFGIPGGAAAVHLNNKRNIPFVLSLRGSDVPRAELSKHQRLHLFTRPYLRGLYQRASGIAAVSQPLKQAALNLMPSVQIDVIPNGVDEEFFAGSDAVAPTHDPAQILYVGRLREFKGVHHIIAALPKIRQLTGNPVKLVVAGEGPFRAELERLAAEAGVDVQFKGWLTAEALRAEYAQASLLALPSAVEGHPNVVLEAMAMGLPCIGADVPGIRDAIDGGVNGLLFPPGNIDALAQAIASLLSDPPRWRAMSHDARKKARGFTWDTVAREYERLLLRAIAGRAA